MVCDVARTISLTTRGLLLTLGAVAGASCFLTTYKVAAGLGATSNAVLVMLTFAALFNSATSVVQSRGRGLFVLDRVSILLSIVLAAFTLLGNHLAVEAVSRISAPLTAVMQQTQVLFVGMLSGVVLKETITPRFWIGAVIAGGGLLTLHLPSDDTLRIDALGTLLAVGSAACFAGMALVTRKYIHRIQPIPVNALRLWMTVGLWFVIERRLPSPAAITAPFVLYCAAAAFFGPFLSRVALMYALRHVPPSTTTLVGLLTPIVTLLPAFVAFGSIPSAREFLGGAIMIGGVALPLLEMRARSRALAAAE